LRRSLLFGLAVTAVFFLLLEAGLRLSGRVATNTLRSPDLETLDAIPGLFEPSQEFIDRIRPDMPYHVTINAQGFRGEDLRTPLPVGWKRILCLGDSYTFGHYVDDNEAWPAVLGSMLGMGQIEVVNGGANGFTIADERILLESKALVLDPAVVVLVFSQNDILDLARPRPMIETMRDHAGLKSKFLLGPILKGLQRTAIFNGMQRLAAGMRGRQREEAKESLASREAALWKEYEKHLMAVSALLDARRIEGLLVSWPTAEQIANDEPSTAPARLEPLARQAGMEFLDLRPALEALRRAGTEPTLRPHDGHPSSAGHKAASVAILAKLADLGWLGGFVVGMRESS
jgi:lysophospholipase L1-like esterase